MKEKEAFDLLKNTKVFVENKTEEIQKTLFEIGYEWYNIGKKVTFTDRPFLYLNDNGILTNGQNVKNFYNDSKTLITADQILQITIEEGFKPFDMVLVRNSKSDKWIATFYSYRRTQNAIWTGEHVCCNGIYNYCIPYEGNEELVGTNKEYNK